jgi:hypothetical protein
MAGMVLSVGTGHSPGRQRFARLALLLSTFAPGLALAACSADDDDGPGASGGAKAGAKASGGASSGGASSGGRASSSGGQVSSGGGRASSTGGRASGIGGATSGGGRSSQAGTTSQAGAGDAGGAGGEAGDAGEGGAAGEASPSHLEQARAAYRSWQKRTSEPYAISTEIFGLCRLPTQSEEEFVGSEHGDNLYLLDWLDEGAQAGFEAEGATPFPVGATIVKEKLVRDGADFDLHALGIMLKREPGFDTAHGDWQFGYWTEAGMVSGTAENDYCGGCHASSTTDFVFLDDSWRMP